MRISVKFTPAMVGQDVELLGETVVVIDTLRATSTIVAALMAGAREVIPVAEIDEAVAVARRLGKDRTLLCGEKGAVKIEGFDLGNSPLEYRPDVVEGKTLVFRTTNGTQALKVASAADTVLCAALVNSTAVAEHLAREMPQKVTLLCAGTEGAFALEDTIAAGALVHSLTVRGVVPVETDGCRAALDLYRQYADDAEKALRECDHGKRLAGKGFAEDIVYCSRCNIPGAVVPQLYGTMLRIAATPE